MDVLENQGRLRPAFSSQSEVWRSRNPIAFHAVAAAAATFASILGTTMSHFVRMKTCVPMLLGHRAPPCQWKMLFCGTPISFRKAFVAGSIALSDVKSCKAAACETL